MSPILLYSNTIDKVVLVYIYTLILLFQSAGISGAYMLHFVSSLGLSRVYKINENMFFIKIFTLVEGKGSHIFFMCNDPIFGRLW